MGRIATLIEISGEHVGRRHHLALPVTVVGRSVRADIQLDHESVSCVHAEVVEHGGSHFVRDRQSRNGTFVNAARIDERALAEGDELIVGRTVLRFAFVASDPGPGGAAPPVPGGPAPSGGAPPSAPAVAWAAS